MSAQRGTKNGYFPLARACVGTAGGAMSAFSKQIVKFIVAASIACPVVGVLAAGADFMTEQWFYGCSYDPNGYSPCLIAHGLLDKDPEPENAERTKFVYACVGEADQNLSWSTRYLQCSEEYERHEAEINQSDDD
jgi:hypothetical protein